MLILGILVAVIVIGIVLMAFDHDELGPVLTTAGIIILVIVLIILPLSRLGYRASIAQYKAVETTLSTLRADGEGLEDAAIQHKVIGMNRWLAGTQFYNTTIWDIWIPDEVMDLEPLK